MYAQISPWNVYDLPLYLWFAFAASADDYTERMRKERQANG